MSLALASQNLKSFFIEPPFKFYFKKTSGCGFLAFINLQAPTDGFDSVFVITINHDHSGAHSLAFTPAVKIFKSQGNSHVNQVHRYAVHLTFIKFGGVLQSIVVPMMRFVVAFQNMGGFVYSACISIISITISSLKLSRLKM